MRRLSKFTALYRLIVLSRLTVLSMIVLSVTSCMTTTSESERGLTVDNAIDTPTSWSSQYVNAADNQARWLEAFNDPVMLKLIEEGKANNLDLRVVSANMDKAWLLARQSGAALEPALDLIFGRAQSGSGDGGPSNPSVNVGLQVSWEMDVWGRLSAGVDAAKAQAQATEADYIFAHHSLSANIAKTYFKIIEAKLQANITRKNLAILNKTLGITRIKYNHGLISAQDLALNRANLASAQEQLISIKGSERDAVRALEVLLGRYPNAELDIGEKLPNLPPSPPSGIPSEILERRPDIIAAERQLASAYGNEDRAKAARLPRFSLTSNVSGASASLSDVLSLANVAWQLESNLVAPLLDGGKRKIDVEIASVEIREALSNYAQQALTAFSEVENNLEQGKILADRESALIEIFSQSDKAYRIAKIRYTEGEIELLGVLQIQQQVIAAESKLLAVQRSQLEQRINLYLSLGGRW